MKPKHAIGITINGNEVRAAFLTLVRGKARIKALESTKLDAPLERVDEVGNGSAKSFNDLENAFDIDEPRVEKDNDDGPELSSNSERDKSVSQIYALLDKFQDIKANVAINSPHLTVKYDTLNKDQLPSSRKKRFKDRIDIWGHENEEGRRSNYIDISDEQVLQVDYEHHPPIIDLIEEVNQFRSNQINLVLMDTNELALSELVKEIYKFEKDEITAIVYIEQDFSRVIFLKGRDIFHITPIVHTGSMSDDVLQVIYSKMIFAQDHYFIPELNKILVAGHSSRLKAKYYFRQKFPSAVTGYLNSKKIQSDLRFKDRGLLFSRYAVPIALAWKALLKRSYKQKNHNLLPEYILERQTMPKLAVHGYLFLFLLAATAFSFTWALVAKNMEIQKVNRQITSMQQQIDNNKSLTQRVHTFDDQIVHLEKKMALVDSFSAGFNETAEFIKTLGKDIRQTGDLWITDFSKVEGKAAISGVSRRRDRIPALASAMGGANLKKVTRSKYLDSDVFVFQLEKILDETSDQKRFDLSSFFQGIQQRPNEKDRTARGGRTGNGAANGATNGHSASNGGGQRPGPANVGKAVAANLNNKLSAKTGTNGATAAEKYVYGLRVGVFDTSEAAMEESGQFKSRGYEVKLSKLSSNSGVIKYAMLVGAFKSYRDAKTISSRLSSQSGIESTIVKYRLTE